MSENDVSVSGNKNGLVYYNWSKPFDSLKEIYMSRNKKNKCWLIESNSFRFMQFYATLCEKKSRFSKVNFEQLLSSN